MHPNFRSIEEWISDVSRGRVLLPRFQRDEVWTPKHVERFLWAIISKRPLGFFLVLKVNPNSQPFHTRSIANSDTQYEECNEHLLDGQQRLAALWRSFSDYHNSHSFYVTFQSGFDDGFDESDVLAVSKVGRDRHIIGNPRQEYAKRWIPVSILKPGEDGLTDSRYWRNQLTDSDNKDAIDAIVERLRSRFNNAVIPYLSLPQDTPRDEAIEIFIETNSSSVRLSAYDLAVAQMEETTSESLAEKVSELVNTVPSIRDLENDVGDLVLKVQCLLEGKKPTYGNYRNLDFDRFNSEWPEMVQGFKWTVELLDDLNIWTNHRLPTAVPLRVLPALHRYVPMSGSDHANSMKVVRKYLWWAFLTDRYERQANDRLKQDFDELVEVISNGFTESRMEIYKSNKPNKSEIKNANWPTSRGILSRAILVAASLGGAKDIATNRALKKDQKRDHHHVFPKSLLRTNNKNPDCVLNCMLLEPLSNQEWAKKWPGDYLIKMVNSSQNHWSDPEAEVSDRLETHLLPPPELLYVKEDSGMSLGESYDSFIDSRLKLIRNRIKTLLAHGTLE